MTNNPRLVQADSSASPAHDNADVFFCGQCQMTWSSVVTFIHHKTTHAGQHTCCLCEEVAPDTESLVQHYATMHGILRLECANSGSIETNAPPLEEEEEEEGEEIKLSSEDSCLEAETHPPSCTTNTPTLHLNIIQKAVIKNDFYFILIAEFVQGKRIKYKRITFKCLHCNLKTYSRLTLCKHMKECHPTMIGTFPPEHTTDGIGEKQRMMSMVEYISQFCQNKPYIQQVKIKRYKKYVEKIEGTKTASCEICGKSFAKLKYLRKHSIIHKTENPFGCDECGKKFKSKTYLQVHVRRHRDKTYSCSQCDFRSNIKATILAHRQIHRAGTVSCKVCGFAYTGKQTLAKHMEVHNLSRPFGCTYPGCTWRFKTEMMCRAHFKAHTTEGKFKCSTCGYIFRRKHHLQRHEQKMHGLQATKAFQTWTDAYHCSLKEKSNDFCDINKSHEQYMLGKISDEMHEDTELQQLVKNGHISSTFLISSVDSNSEVEINANPCQSEIKSIDMDSFPIETVDEVHSSTFFLSHSEHFDDKQDPIAVEELTHSSIETLMGVTTITVDNGHMLE